MKILATSDWHLDVITSGVPRLSEITNTVEHSIKVAIDQRVGCYIMIGDLSDPDNSLSILASAYAVEVATRLKAAGIPSIWVAGNHDVMENGFGTTTLTPLAKSGSADMVFEQPGVHLLGGVTFIGLPFTPRSHAYEPEKFIKQTALNLPSAQKSGPIVILGHLNLTGITPGSETEDMPRGREVLWPTAVIKKYFPTALCLGGHYHKSQEYDGVNIVGSLARLSHGEEEHNPSMMMVTI